MREGKTDEEGDKGVLLLVRESSGGQDGGWGGEEGRGWRIMY